MKRSENGITLIALVITIIVLIILAGVAIRLALGDNDGMIKKTNEASTETKIQGSIEMLKIKIAAVQAETYGNYYREPTLKELAEALDPEVDDEVRCLTKQSQKQASIDWIDDDDYSTIFVIFKKYTEVELEIDETLNVINTNIIDPSTLVDPEFHHWDEGEVIAEATCTTEGTTIYHCTDDGCEEVKEVTTPALGHKKSDTYSCTTTGHFFSCERCGIALTDEEAHTSSTNCSVCGYKGTFTVSNNFFKLTGSNTATTVNNGSNYSTTLTPTNSLTYMRPSTVSITMGGTELTSGYSYNSMTGALTINSVRGNIVITAQAVNYNDNTSFSNAAELALNTKINIVINQSYQVRVFKFTPTVTGTYLFQSEDSSAAAGGVDPYGYLFKTSSTVTLDSLDDLALRYAQTGATTEMDSVCLTKHDDIVRAQNKNFNFTYNCTAGETYYLSIRTFHPEQQQSFSNISISKVN